jgi:hypothetical protein
MLIKEIKIYVYVSNVIKADESREGSGIAIMKLLANLGPLSS